MINQANLKTILYTIFDVDEKYIVPKQGTWWNQQDKTNSGTWIAYIIRRTQSRSLPFWQLGTMPDTNGDGSEISTVYSISDIDLQIVGPDSEAIAQSIQHWNNRQDIIDLFDSYHAQLCYDGLGDYDVSSFTQEGLNSSLAYNVRVRVQWANMIDVEETQVDTVNMTGNLTIGDQNGD